MVTGRDVDVVERHLDQLGDLDVRRAHGVSSGGVDPARTRQERRERAARPRRSRASGSLAAIESGAARVRGGGSSPEADAPPADAEKVRPPARPGVSSGRDMGFEKPTPVQVRSSDHHCAMLRNGRSVMMVLVSANIKCVDAPCPSRQRSSRPIGGARPSSRVRRPSSSPAAAFSCSVAATAAG